MWFDAAVRLTGYMNVTEIVTLGEVDYFEGPHSWDGYIRRLTEEDLRTLQAVGTFELRLPDVARVEPCCPRRAPISIVQVIRHSEADSLNKVRPIHAHNVSSDACGLPETEQCRGRAALPH